MPEAYIGDGVRTPIGCCGTLCRLYGSGLNGQGIALLLERAN